MELYLSIITRVGYLKPNKIIIMTHNHIDDIELDLTDNTQLEKFKAAKKSTLVSVFVNIVLSIWQITVGFFSHSQGLIADGIHSLSDLIADFVVLIANKGSQKRPAAAARPQEIFPRAHAAFDFYLLFQGHPVNQRHPDCIKTDYRPFLCRKRRTEA